MDRYTVTVPVVVAVDFDGLEYGYRIEIDIGYPGFFSEASEAEGVWSVDRQIWDRERWDVALLARERVEEKLLQ